MSIQSFFNMAVVIYTVGNLASMGLELNVLEAITALWIARFVALAFIWGWVVGPAFAYLLTMVLPLAEPYAMGLLLAGPAPCAPFYPLVGEESPRRRGVCGVPVHPEPGAGIDGDDLAGGPAVRDCGVHCGTHVCRRDRRGK